jgi:hypothetical protein
MVGHALIYMDILIMVFLLFFIERETDLINKREAKGL